MANIPSDLKYTKSHEWIKHTGEGTALIGITDFAQNSLGDIVFVNLPEADTQVSAGETVAEVESVKAVSNILAPAAGTISRANEELDGAPEMINESPYEAWIYELTDISDAGELLDADEYAAHLEAEEA